MRLADLIARVAIASGVAAVAPLLLVLAMLVALALLGGGGLP